MFFVVLFYEISEKSTEQSGTPTFNDDVHSMQTSLVFRIRVHFVMSYEHLFIIGHNVHMILNNEMTGFNTHVKLNITS